MDQCVPENVKLNKGVTRRKSTAHMCEMQHDIIIIYSYMRDVSMDDATESNIQLWKNASAYNRT